MTDQWVEWPDSTPPRRLTKEDIRQRFTEVRPVVMEDSPNAHNVFLKVSNQEFYITKWACDTLEEAEWLRDQLCTALDRIVREAVE